MHVQHPLDTLLREIPTASIRSVLDLGAGSGSSALHLQRALPHATVYAFECDPSAIEGCRAAFRGTSIMLVGVAIGDANGTLPIHLGATNGLASSRLPPKGHQGGPIAQVPCTRLDSWCREHGIAPDLIWCDVEADPLSPLRGMGPLLSNTSGIYVPVLYRPLYLGQTQFAELDSFVRSQGFRLVDHVQSLPGQWGYALYVNGKIPRRLPTQAFAPEADTRPFARGGIGDLLQYVTSARNARSIRAYSHYDGARAFFARLGVEAEHTPFHANTTFISWAEAGTELARDYFPQLPVPAPALAIREGTKRLLGLHPVGSGYSNTFAQRFSAPAKWMPPSFCQSILSEALSTFDHALVFCAPNEAHHMANLLGPFLRIATVVSLPDVWDSLSMVQLCDAVVGVDSSIKTMASMLRIPTITLVGDYDEPFRDRHFLQPYVRAGVMKTMRYRSLGAQEGILAHAMLTSLLAERPETP